MNYFLKTLYLIIILSSGCQNSQTQEKTVGYLDSQECSATFEFENDSLNQLDTVIIVVSDQQYTCINSEDGFCIQNDENLKPGSLKEFSRVDLIETDGKKRKHLLRKHSRENHFYMQASMDSENDSLPAKEIMQQLNTILEHTGEFWENDSVNIHEVKMSIDSLDKIYSNSEK